MIDQMIDERIAFSLQLVREKCELEAEVERLRAALQEIADMRYSNTSAATIAQRALQQEK